MVSKPQKKKKIIPFLRYAQFFSVSSKTESAGLAVHRALCPSTLIERRREGKDVVEKTVQAIGITAPWRGL